MEEPLIDLGDVEEMVAGKDSHLIPLDEHLQTDRAFYLFLHPCREMLILGSRGIWRFNTLLQVWLTAGRCAVCGKKGGLWLFFPS